MLPTARHGDAGTCGGQHGTGTRGLAGQHDSGTTRGVAVGQARVTVLMFTRIFQTACVLGEGNNEGGAARNLNYCHMPSPGNPVRPHA